MKKLFFLIIVLSLVACGSPDLSKIEIGMSESEVVELIGEPVKEEKAEMGVVVWNYRGQKVVILKAGEVKATTEGEEESQKALLKVLMGEMSGGR